MARNQSVREVDFGYSTAQEYWIEVVIPAYEKFRADQKRGNAIQASWPAWHVHEWIWYEMHPGVDTSGNSNYRSFQRDLIDRCEEIAWVRDIADAGKHRYLGRKSEVQRMHPAIPRALKTSKGILMTAKGILMTSGVLEIELTDGTRHPVPTVLNTVIEFWRGHFEGGQPLS